MKKGILALMIVLAVSAWGQTCTPTGGVSCTPNLDLWLPPLHYQNWNVPMNANTSILDTFAGTAVVKNPTAPQEIRNQPLILDSAFTAQSVNAVVNAASYASLNAAAAACSGACTIDINAPISLSANLSLPSTTTIRFNQPGSVTMNGHTLTTGTIVAPAYQIFDSCTGLAYGTIVTTAPVEWCGATADGKTGSDDTAAIQQTINALQAGMALLSNGGYRIAAGPIQITKSSVGIQGVGMRTINANLYPAPPASVLVNTTAGNDTIDVFGTSTSNNVTFTTLRDFNVERSVAPTGTAKGISLNYTYGATIKNVGSLDSVYGFYFHATGSQGTGVVEDSQADWGYNGFSEAAGNYYGFYLDSADGAANPSFRIRHSFAVDGNGNPAVIAYGLADVGTEINDLMSYGFETATVAYGVYVHQTGVHSVITSADIHFYGGINDGCVVSCYYISGLTSSAGAGLEINGGYLTVSGTNSNPMIDIESSFGVRVSGVQLGIAANTNAGALIDVNNSSDVILFGNEGMGIRNTGILLSGSTAVTVTGNDLYGNASANGLITLTNSSLNTVGLNVLTGTGASLVVDSSSNGNAGLNTNSIAGGLTVASIAGNNPIFNGTTAWIPGIAGAPTGSCPNGSFTTNSSTTSGTYPTYQCKNSAWVGIGTAY